VEAGQEEVHRHQREQDRRQARQAGERGLPPLPAAQASQQQGHAVDGPGDQGGQDLGIVPPRAGVEALGPQRSAHHRAGQRHESRPQGDQHHALQHRERRELAVERRKAARLEVAVELQEQERVRRGQHERRVAEESQRHVEGEKRVVEHRAVRRLRARQHRGQQLEEEHQRDHPETGAALAAAPFHEPIDHRHRERHHRQRLGLGGGRQLPPLGGEPQQIGEVEQDRDAQRRRRRALGAPFAGKKDQRVVDRHQQIGERQDDQGGAEEVLQSGALGAVLDGPVASGAGGSAGGRSGCDRPVYATIFGSSVPPPASSLCAHRRCRGPAFEEHRSAPSNSRL
jgi:hypothetical protein